MKMAATLFTIGYEGLSMDRFIAQLKAAGVRRVVDVRELPLSHKPGFSKRALSRALEGAGLAYEHIPALGCPRPIRNRYRADKNWPAYARAFRAHLAKQSDTVRDLAQSARTATACLLCFEANHDRCHRTFVAEGAASASNLRVVHLSCYAESPATFTAMPGAAKG
jgi:uncharacterized protein (DUF488 family)